MLKRLYKSLIASRASSDTDPNPKEPAAHVISRDEHGISRKQMSANALTVIYELRRAGYDAYLVGGGVRDLLLDKKPKDFDIATNATPEQIHQQFRRSRIIGRRFKIVHVRFGREIIEVTTFRANHNQLDQQNASAAHAQTNTHGMLVRDNVYGSLREDALRRDFTVNALYYSVDGFKILDYVGGMEDLQQKTLKIIGQADLRYKEDPVRMLRAVRFSAKLDFKIDPATAKPISELSHLLKQVAPPRLFDEVLKLLLSGYGKRVFDLLVEYQLFSPLFPATGKILNANHSFFYTLIANALDNTDQRIADGKPVTPAFLYGTLLWPVVCQHVDRLEAEGVPRVRALQLAGHEAIDEQIPVISIPKRFSIAMREIWSMQYRLENTQGKRALTVLQHPRFRAAYDFLLLREQSGEELTNRGQFWTQLQIDHPLPSPQERSRTKHTDSPSKRRRSSRSNSRNKTEKQLGDDS